MVAAWTILAVGAAYLALCLDAIERIGEEQPAGCAPGGRSGSPQAQGRDGEPAVAMMAEHEGAEAGRGSLQKGEDRMGTLAAERVRGVIGSYRYAFIDEKDLQDGIAEALARGGLGFEREVRLAPRDVVDFLVEGGVGVEVKVEGAVGAILRQLARYARSDRVKALLLVTRKMQHAGRFPSELGGKPLLVTTLEASAL